MAYDRFLIAPLKSGLITSLPAWQIPEDSFERLRNAYVFRGRVTKRVGAELMGTGASSSQTAPLRSRLRIQVGTTNGAGAAAGNVPGVIFKVGQQFSIGDEIFTVNVAGAPAAMLTTGAATTATYNTATGAYVFAGADATTPVFFYPAEPVMGITNYEVGDINNQPTLAFDTQFAYQYVTTAWGIAGPIPPAANSLLLQSDTLDYVWATNWSGITDNITLLFITNFNATYPAPAGTDDPMYYWNGTNWTNFSALTVFNTGTDFVQTARIILPFKDRLILLNTIERNVGGGTNASFPNRCRFSHNGSPLSTTAWYEPNVTIGGNNASGGGFIDAATKEEIVSAQFIKDRLIVYFERSTWELAYTGNQVLPFVWQQLNSELGAIGTFSTTPFDRAVLGIGDTGVHACNGSNVERIDDTIPDEIFEISKASNGSKRVAGIRDYTAEMVYWSFPSVEINPINTNRYPDRLLVYNYTNSTWSLWDDTFTAFGYFYQQSDVIWSGLFNAWQDYDLDWIGGVQYQQERRVVAGNQQGYIVALTRDLDVNAQAYSITDVAIGALGVITLTVIDHNFESQDYIRILDLSGITGFTEGIYQIDSIVSINTITVIIPALGGTYEGGGSITRVSQIDILTKQWNPYIAKGFSFYLPYIDFCVRRTALSEITVDYFSSGSYLSMVGEAMATGMNLGTNVLETRAYATVPFEATQDRLWHRVYFQTDGQFIQLRLYWDDTQMRNTAISLADFTLEGLILNTQRASSDLEI